MAWPHDKTGHTMATDIMGHTMMYDIHTDQVCDITGHTVVFGDIMCNSRPFSGILILLP